MIFTDRTIMVKNGTSSINDTIVLYRGDRDVEIRFTLNEGTPFKFGSGVSPNIIEKTEATYGQLVIKTPGALPPIFSEVTPTIGGKIIFTITAEMIDETTEVGNYTFQIRLLDDNMESRATLPEVKNGIEIREPIALEDISTTNEVEVAAVGYAMTTAGTPEDTFDSQGNYNKTTWGTGDRITATKLNKIEAGIDGVNKKVASISTNASGISIQDSANNFTADNVEGALAELFQSVSSGKSLIASAITDKGVSTSNTATFQEMATNIGSITTQQEGITSEVEVTWQDGYKLDRNTGAETTGQDLYFACDYIAYENGLYYELVSDTEIKNIKVSIDVFYYDVNKNYLGAQDNFLGMSHNVQKETTKLKIEPLTNAKFIRFRGYNNKSIFPTHAELQSHLTFIKSGVAKYSITYNLTNVTSSNTDTTIEGGKAYTTTLTANSGYKINTPTITVDGLDVTSKYYSNGVFTINNVFGNIVITADATEIIIGKGLTLNYTFNNETPGNGYGTISLLASSDDTAGTYTIQYADDNGALSNYDNICTLTTTNGVQADYNYFIKDQMIPKYATKIIAVKDNQTMAEFVIPEAKRFTSGNYGQHLYSFGAISDIHTGADTWDTDLQEAFTYLNEKESVLFTCASGDITDNGTQTQFENFKAIKDTYTPNTPFYATNGNHEWYNSSFSDDFWRTYIDNDRTCLFTQGNDVFIMFGNEGTGTNCFSAENKAWLETQLARYANCRVFVFNHYFINGTDNGNFNNYYDVNVLTTTNAPGQWMLGLLKQYPNMFYVTGHSHMKFIVQELCNTITIRNDWDGSETGYMVHLPSITNPRDVINGSFTGKLSAQSEGVVIDVYENCVLYRGRNFVDKKFIPIGQYLLPKAQGILPSENEYVIAKQLNNSTSSNSATVAVKNSSYTTTITPNDGYVINKITVLMGGADVTSTVVSGNIITIDSVTGDISITVKTIAVTDKDNAIWEVMMLSQTTGEEQPNDTAGLSSQYITYNSGHTYTLFMKAGLYYTSKVFCYDANQSYITNIAHSAPVNGDYTTVDYYSSLTIPENTAYIRLRTRKQTNGHGDLTTNTVNNYIKLLTEQDMVAITGISLSATELVFDTQDTQTLTVTKTPSNATVNVSFNSSDNRIATVNELGIVTPVARGNCVITATAGDATATCNVTVTNTLKSISTNLCQVTSSNSVTSYVEGASYNTTLTADDGGSINHVRITMGGEDITNTAYNANTGEVNIASVTSDVVINALGVSSTETVKDVTASDFTVREGNPTITTNDDGSITVTFKGHGQKLYVANGTTSVPTKLVLYVEDVQYSLSLTDELKEGIGFKWSGDKNITNYTMTTGTSFTLLQSTRSEFNVSNGGYRDKGGTIPVSITFRNCKLISQ